jgi:hypothetical protein
VFPYRQWRLAKAHLLRPHGCAYNLGMLAKQVQDERVGMLDFNPVRPQRIR